MEKDSIIRNDNELKITLVQLVFEEDGNFFAFIPSLMLITTTKYKDDLSEQMLNLVKHFFEWHKDEKLLKKLKHLDWNEFEPPYILRMPYEIIFKETEKTNISLIISI